MESRRGIKWSREETILAYELYCRTPFGKITSSNPDIIELAQLLGRTPGSVGLKMHNLAHYDPELQKRNVTAMSHTSKLDKEVFLEFCNGWTELSYQAQLIKAKMQKLSLREAIDIEDIYEIPEGDYREQLVKNRVGQDFFRATVLNAYGNRCCVTGLVKPDLLIASHIKPWSVCDEKTEQTNPSNGLCLNSFHDKAFDKGYITLDPKYRIVISKQLKDVEMDVATKEWFWDYEGKQIALPDKFLPDKKFIEYHNELVFKR